MKKTIGGKLRKLIFKIRYMRNSEYDSNKKYYIIYRNDDMAGLGSYFITNLGQMKYAIDNNKIPIVDMKNFANVYQEPYDYCKVNSWDYYFEQDIDSTNLEDIYRSDNWTFCKSGVPYPNVNIDTLLNKKLLNEWHEVYEKCIHLRGEITVSVDEFWKSKIGGDNKTVGVLLRGTDYFAFRPKGHPVQPEVDVSIDEVKKKRAEWAFDKIFLVTEDNRIQEAFLEEFGDEVILPNSLLYKYEDGKYVGELAAERDNDRYLHGKEYLEALVLLGKCDYFIAGITSGTVCSRIMAEGFEKEFYFNLGVYS